MCGRTACFLSPENLCSACGYKDATGKQRKASWVKSELEYKPSTNMGPRDSLPCLVDGSHFGNEDERVLCAMMWGMIPPWHEGDYRKHKMSTHNGRLENIKESKLYSGPLRKGQRCVVVCNGFYEWKAGKTKQDKTQPYFIYPSQEDNIKLNDSKTWKNEWSQQNGWAGVKVLKLAGIFNTFKTGEGKVIYSCTVITRDSNTVLSWLHHRSPVFLNTEQDVQDWLNKDIALSEAVNTLNKLSLVSGILKWHPVSATVNSVFNKADDCINEVKVVEQKKSGPNSLMASWLKKGSTESAKRNSTGMDTDSTKSTPNERPSKKKKDE